MKLAVHWHDPLAEPGAPYGTVSDVQGHVICTITRRTEESDLVRTFEILDPKGGPMALVQTGYGKESKDLPQIDYKRDMTRVNGPVRCLDRPFAQMNLARYVHGSKKYHVRYGPDPDDPVNVFNEYNHQFDIEETVRLSKRAEDAKRFVYDKRFRVSDNDKLIMRIAEPAAIVGDGRMQDCELDIAESADTLTCVSIATVISVYESLSGLPFADLTEPELNDMAESNHDESDHDDINDRLIEFGFRFAIDLLFSMITYGGGFKGGGGSGGGGGSSRGF